MARSPPRNLTALIFRPRHDYLPGADILRQIDVDALAERLDLDKRGEADGLAGRPARTDRGRTSAEADIQGALHEIWEESLKGAKRAHEGLRGRFASLTAETELDSLLAEPAAVALTLRETAREERDRLLFQHHAVRDAGAELSRFQAREGLERPAREPGSVIGKLALLAFAALVELVVNASIFAGGEEYGLVGAVTKVVVIPIANIGGCFVLTHWLARQVLVRSPGLKIVGVIGFGLTAAWLLGLNLAVAHWRDAAGAPTTAAEAGAALDALIADPLHLHSFQSWGLFLVGCFAGAVAIWEGWNWWDPHPGYSRRTLQAETAQARFRAMRSEAMDRLRAEADSGANRLGEAQRTAETAMAQRPALAIRSASLADDVALFAQHLRRVGDELALRYREANRRTRTAPAPTHFDEPLALDLATPEFPALTAPTAERPVAGALAEAIAKITAAHAQACAAIPSLSELAETPDEAANGAPAA